MAGTSGSISPSPPPLQSCSHCSLLQALTTSPLLQCCRIPQNCSLVTSHWHTSHLIDIKLTIYFLCKKCIDSCICPTTIHESTGIKIRNSCKIKNHKGISICDSCLSSSISSCSLFLRYPRLVSGLVVRAGAAHCTTALRGEEVQLQSLQQLSPALQPGLTAALQCEICSSCIVPCHFRCWYEAGTEVQLESEGWCWLPSAILTR